MWLKLLELIRETTKKRHEVWWWIFVRGKKVNLSQSRTDYFRIEKEKIEDKLNIWEEVEFYLV